MRCDSSELIEMVRPQIVLFGDSIVEDSFRSGGWGASLSHTFSRKADVIVRGYDGYNTRWASLLLDQLFPLIGPIVPCATLVFFGANDSALLGSSSQRQHVPQDQYKDNLKKIVTHLKELSPSMAVVLVTPLPVDEIRGEAARSIHGDKKKKVPDRTNEMTGLYARQCLEVAHEMQLPWIDLWFAMQQMSNWQKLFFDGSQLTEEGNEFVHREVVQALVEAGLSAQDMQLDFPRHSEIEEAHPEHAFQQDIHSSHLVDLDYEEDFVAEMVIPSSTEDSKLTSPSLHPAPAFELDSLLVPLPDNAFFPSSSCANSFCGPPSYMAYPTAGFTDTEQNTCQMIPTIQIKEEPLIVVATSSSILPPTRIKEEHPGPTTPLKDEMCASSAQKTAGKKGKKCEKSKKRSSKKAKRRPSTRPPTRPPDGSKTVAKACVHCQTTKTPQWRTGPDGARSLCNACGVRYRLGRLYPEYRPISSPSFVPQLHSNSHREVAKLRRLNSRQVD